MTNELYFPITFYNLYDTKYNELFDKYTNEKVCIGVAMIDNYEEIIQRLLPEEKLQVIAINLCSMIFVIDVLYSFIQYSSL